ncbi:MAG: hypothetical protein DRJ40_08815 [Thermoprotei archaeon]|nr:MAG: hypothetical protein DRJ40_08815 [Thermoprotei archaeon]
MNSHCEKCIYYEEIRRGVGYCHRRGETIIFHERYSSCPYYVPRDICEEFFIERAYLELERKKEKKRESVVDKIVRLLRRRVKH